MNRRTFVKLSSILASGSILHPIKSFANPLEQAVFSKAQFGNNFLWGTATAAAQIEGAWNTDGKGRSIWDTFCLQEGKIKDGTTNQNACNFYYQYKDDIALMRQMGFDVFRFSTAWSRILPYGTKHINQRGIDFYNRIIDETLEKGMQPWLTLYHWDLPQILQDKGGWENRDIVNWFGEYASICAKHFGDRVQNWMVLNEPLAFTSLGYMLGWHAPGLKGVKRFLKATHHTTLAQAEGGRVLKSMLPNANIGTTFSCSAVEPKNNKEKHINAAKRLDAFLNRLFIDPAMGKGYPINDLPLIKGIEKYMHAGDKKNMQFEFDFIGIQNYFRTVARFSVWPPIMWANFVKATKLVDNPQEEITQMGWEVSPEGIYRILKQFNTYGKPIFVTENGAAFKDTFENGQVHDKLRVKFYQDYLQNVLKAKQEGVDVRGYFLWTFMDNFEWAEGYEPRFGMVYNDFESQKRYKKDSGIWWENFLKS